jgi:hypothetical protein
MLSGEAKRETSVRTEPYHPRSFALSAPAFPRQAATYLSASEESLVRGSLRFPIAFSQTGGIEDENDHEYENDRENRRL